jgi:peroxiredoxin
VPVLFLFLGILTGISVIQNNAHSEQVIHVEQNSDLASDFTLHDLGSREIKLSDYKGKPILLYFMTTWCRDCRATISSLKSVYSMYHEKGLVILNIDVLESMQRVKAFVEKNAVPYPVLLDEDGSVSRIYGVVGVPVMALINRDGRIICWNCGSWNKMIEKQFSSPSGK